ncbi:MAG: S1/P1 nuclease [FCB group bacterium]|nr:S1/P1 nuclease [FCB group bacterium]
MQLKRIRTIRNVPRTGLATILIMSSLMGFGFQGHQIVATIASHRLSARAQAEVVRLLDGNPTESMVAASTWADEIRSDSSYDYARTFHYVNLPPDASDYQAERDCPDQACVVGAIRRYEKVLADSSASLAEQQEALKFLIHFVGDLHQPLHAGLAADRGGNDITVIFNGETSNLHRLWDYLLIETRQLSVEDYTSELESKIKRWDAAQWSKGQPETWAVESFQLARNYAYPLPENGNISPDYAKKGLIILDLQMEKAGVRLAWILNQIYRQ